MKLRIVGSISIMHLNFLEAPPWWLSGKESAW